MAALRSLRIAVVTFGGIVALVAPTAAQAQTAPPACSPDKGTVLLDAPESVAYGRPFTVRFTGNPVGRNFVLEVLDLDGRTVLDSERTEFAGLDNSLEIELGAPFAPGVLTAVASWDHRTAGCRVTATRQVTVWSGSRPAFQFKRDPPEELALLINEDGCTGAVGRARVTVDFTYRGAKRLIRRRYTNNDPCEYWDVSGKGAIPGVRIVNALGRLLLRPPRCCSYYSQIRMRVRREGETVVNGYVYAWNFRVPPQRARYRRVWQGTDGFFNYCVKKGKELYSQGLRLYCLKPVSSGSPELSERQIGYTRR
jgi:hypothetical protein